ncbi:hypothetical protein BKA62DRAFT_597305, partial [Auriculariales sp. MPI-PUGE-AT-0066]
KLMWNGRRDAIEIRRVLHASVGCVWDLQLVDITSRSLRGDQTGRAGIDDSSHPLHTVSDMDLGGIFALTSVYDVLKVHNVKGGPEPGPELDADDPRWMERPLPPDFLRHAERDILLIARTYQIFSSRGYLRHEYQLLLEQQSSRYINMFNKPIEKSIFATSGTLPMDVLNDPELDHTPKKQCNKCHRTLSAPCFVLSKYPHKRKRPQTTCKVCFVNKER